MEAVGRTEDAMDVEKELNCEGYFGFGGGYVMGKRGKPLPGEASYCNTCPLKDSCWTKHKERCATIVPAVVAAFEEMAKMMKGPELVQTWWQIYDAPDPYTTILVGNMKDGTAVAVTGKPKDRGQNTLPWPFVNQ